MDEDTAALTSFGTSLSLSTTLRHSIQSEISQLDAASAALLKTIQNESSIQRGIQKEMERAKREMNELTRGGGDVVEMAVVGGGVAKGWREVLEGEMKASVEGVNAVSDDDGEDDGEPARFLPRQKSALKSKVEGFEAIATHLNEAKDALANLEEETNRILSDLNRLNSQNGKVAEEVERKRIEYETECRRNARVKEAIGRSRAMSGGFARGIADKAQEQIAQRSANLTKESSLTSELEAKNQEMTFLSAEQKKLDAELSLLSGLLDSFIQQHVEGEMEIKRSAGIKVELDEVKQEMEEVMVVKEDKTKVANDATKELEEAKALYEQASAAAKELDAIKSENDNADTTLLQPALTRKVEASKEKERLVGEVSELHKAMAEQQSKINETVAGTDAKASVMSEELKDAKEMLEKAKSTLDELLKAASANEEAHAKELQETKDFSAHFEAATQGEIARLETMKRQKTDERLAKLDTRRSELASLEDMRREEIHHLNEALSFLEKMRDVEVAIKDAEVELTEEGEELNLMSEEHEKIIADLKARIAENEGTNECSGDDREDMETCASPTMKRRLSQ